jgi:hypothetical protein
VPAARSAWTPATFPKEQRPVQDTLQLGGDFVVGGDGRLVYAFRSADPDDRPPVADLIAAAAHRT